MPQFICLLRGINVGKAKRIPMAELRSLLAESGFTEIATLLNSGNAVFHAPKGTPEQHAAAIKSTIASRLKIDVPVVVKSAMQFAVIVAGNPFADTAPDHSRLLVAFVQEAKALASLRSIEALITQHERFAIGQQAAYLQCAGGILDSKAGAALLGKPGQAATSRNWATVLKLLALADSNKA